MPRTLPVSIMVLGDDDDGDGEDDAMVPADCLLLPLDDGVAAAGALPSTGGEVDAAAATSERRG